MNRTKRGAALAVAMLIVLVACSSGGSDGASSSAPGASPGDPSGTLRLFSYSDGFDPEYMASFYKEYPGIDLETASFGSQRRGYREAPSGV